MQELVIVVKIPSEMKRNNRIVATVTPQDVLEGVTFFGDNRMLQTGALTKEKISVKSAEEAQLIDAPSSHVYDKIEVEPVSLQTVIMDAPIEDTIVEPSIGYDGIKRVDIKGVPSTFMDVSPNSAFAETITVTPKKYKQIISRSAGKYIDKVFVEPVVQKEEQEKYIQPIKEEQEVLPDAGFVMSKVTVGAIPESYFDVSAVNISSEDVIAGKQFVDNNGDIQTGTIPVYEGETEILENQTLATAGKYMPSDLVVSAKEPKVPSRVVMTLQDTTYWEGGNRNYFTIPLSAESVEGDSLMPCEYLGVLPGKNVRKVRVSGRIIFAAFDSRAIAGIIMPDTQYIADFVNCLLDDYSYDSSCAAQVWDEVETFEDSDNVAINIPPTILDLSLHNHRCVRMCAFGFDVVTILASRQNHPEDKTYLIVEAIED